MYASSKNSAEYLLLLRQAVKPTPSRSSANGCHFDLGVLWKKAYDKSEAERLKILDELAIIRQNNDLTILPPTNPLPRKRKTPLSQSSNRANDPQVEEVKALADLRQDLISELEASKSTGWTSSAIALLNSFSQTAVCHSLLRAVFLLTRAVNSQTTDRTRLGVSFKLLADAVSTSLGQENKIEGPTKSALPTLTELCAVFERIYPCALKLLRCTVPEENNGKTYAGVVDMVTCFQSFLGRLHQAALDQFVEESNRAKPGRRKSVSMEKVSSQNQMKDDQTHTEKRVLLNVMISMINTLDVSQESHCQILEGFLSALLDHIGSSLSLLVFADSKSPPEESVGLYPPDGLLQVSHLKCSDALGAARIEGPGLVLLLRNALNFLHKAAKTMPENYLIQFLPETSKKLDKSSIWNALKETLQRTLLRGVFGDDDEATANDTLRTFYSDEDDDQTRVALTELEDENSEDWYIGQLWEHLGWDILASRKVH